MKQSSSTTTGHGLRRLEHAADADAARQVHVLADLRARTDRRPRVDHRAAVDVGADVHVARHHHDAPGQEGAEAGRRAGHDPHPGRFVAVLQRQLVDVLERPRLDRLHLLHAEPHEDRVLGRLVDDDRAVDHLGDADLTAVELPITEPTSSRASAIGMTSRQSSPASNNCVTCFAVVHCAPQSGFSARACSESIERELEPVARLHRARAGRDRRRARRRDRRARRAGRLVREPGRDLPAVVGAVGRAAARDRTRRRRRRARDPAPRARARIRSRRSRVAGALHRRRARRRRARRRPRPASGVGTMSPACLRVSTR